MALALGVSLGDVFYVGDTPVKVIETVGYNITLQVEGKKYLLRPDFAVEILKNVFVDMEKVLMEDKEEGVEYPSYRVLIDAPREITILRESLYVKSRQVSAAAGGGGQGPKAGAVARAATG